MYRELDPERIVETSVLLQRRIQERFPDSSLSRIALELVDVAKSARQVSTWLARPIVWVRVAVGVAVAILAFLVVVALRVVNLDMTGIGFSETAQGVEAAVNNLVFVAIAIYFLIWWITLFAVLPFGVRSQHEGEDFAQGTDPGAPIADTRIGRRR